MQSIINEIHFYNFRSMSLDYEAWTATRIPSDFAKVVGVSNDIANMLSTTKVDRDYLKSLCANPSVSSEIAFISIMAWGGMKYKHGRLSWPHRKEIMPIIDEIRSGTITRSESYARFQNFRLKTKGSGLGPAFFTKIIFFGHPRHDGYIMDQWTSLGINLLFSNQPEPIVKMSTGYYRQSRFDSVTDQNTERNFEDFCEKIESISGLLDISAEDVELRLFSNGGHKPGPWRQYVKEQRCSP